MPVVPQVQDKAPNSHFHMRAYGWSEMQRDLTKIKELATDMQRTAKK